MVKSNRLLLFSDMWEIIQNHPMGLLIAILIFILILIFRDVLKCLFLLFIRLPFNLQTPDLILAGGICDPDKMFKIQLALKISDLFNYGWFVYAVIILGVVLFLYFQYKKNKK